MSAPKAFHLTETSLARGTSLIEASAGTGKTHAITALFIVGWQYARRKTALGRALAVAAVILIPLVRLIFPWSADSWIQF